MPPVTRSPFGLVRLRCGRSLQRNPVGEAAERMRSNPMPRLARRALSAAFGTHTDDLQDMLQAGLRDRDCRPRSGEHG